MRIDDEIKELELSAAEAKTYREVTRRDNMAAQQDAKDSISIILNGIESSIDVG